MLSDNADLSNISRLACKNALDFAFFLIMFISIFLAKVLSAPHGWRAHQLCGSTGFG